MTLSIWERAPSVRAMAFPLVGIMIGSRSMWMTMSQLLVLLSLREGICVEEGEGVPHSRRHRHHNYRPHMHRKFEVLTGPRPKC